MMINQYFQGGTLFSNQDSYGKSLFLTGEPSMNQPFSLCEIPRGSGSNCYLNGIGDRSKGIPIMNHLGHLGMESSILLSHVPVHCWVML